MSMTLEQMSDMAYYFCFQASLSGDGRVTPETINKATSGKVSQHQALLALQALQAHRTVEMLPSTNPSQPEFRLTLGGYKKAEAAMQEENSPLSSLNNSFEKASIQAIGQLGGGSIIYPAAVAVGAVAGTAISIAATAENSNEAASQGWTQGPVTNESIPASDRYVSVRDNQQAFDALAKSLNQIKDEYAKDHNKGDYSKLPGAPELISEIDATLAQTANGTVRKDQLTQGLKPALKALLAVATAYEGLLKMLKGAADLLDELLKAVGIQ